VFIIVGEGLYPPPISPEIIFAFLGQLGMGLFPFSNILRSFALLRMTVWDYLISTLSAKFSISSFIFLSSESLKFPKG
jgi:hypothetical protein